MDARHTIYLDPETVAAWRRSGKSLADLVRRGLEADEAARLLGWSQAVTRLEDVPDPHDEHTVDGPANCRRCQLLRENAHWMAVGGGSGDVGGYEVADNPPQDPVSYADPDFRPPDNPERRRGGVED